MEIRIISNIIGLEGATGQGFKVKLIPYPKNTIGIIDIFRLFLKSFSCDYIILNFSSFDFFVLALFKLIFPFNRCRLVTLDLFLVIPESLKDRIARWVKITLLKKAYKFLVYSKNNSGYQATYKISPDKFIYIPYKVNALQLILKTQVSDEGYVFCGGKSRRDFATLFEAARKNKYPVKIVTVGNAELFRHGSFLDDKSAPDNVQIIRHDGSIDLFIKTMAAARLVVIPIRKDIITQAGIAVYLMAMALKKCVIISAGPGVDDILPPGAAVIVPPGEIKSLQEAIEKAFENTEWRNLVATAGFDYAMSLNGVIKMQQAIEDFIYGDFARWRVSERN